MDPAVTLITDHSARAVAALPEQFRSATALQALVETFADEIQEIETAISQLVTLRALADCTGVQLDGWGQIAGVLRAGRSDTDYRQAIYGQILINNSQGECWRMSSALQILTLADHVHYLPVYPAAYQMETDGAGRPDNLHQVMEAVSPLGVGLVGIVYADPDEDALVWATEGGVVEIGLGFSEIDPESPPYGLTYFGGMIAELI